MPSSFKRRLPSVDAVSSVSLDASSLRAGEGATSSPETQDTDSSAAHVGPSQAPSPASLPPGVKPSTYSSPVPVVSTGIAALDDIISGSGLPSGSLLLLIPSTGTNPLPPVATGAPEALDSLALSAAEPYNELVLQYGIAQGLYAGHANIVIGECAEQLANSVMARIGEEQGAEKEAEATSSHKQEDQQVDRLAAMALTSSEDDEDDPSATPSISSSSGQLKIAFRYDRMSRFSTSISSHQKAANQSQKAEDEAKFCAQFDLSKRVSPRVLEKARARDGLHFFDVACDSGEADAYEEAWRAIEARVNSIASSCSSNLAVRISVRSLGSNAWMRRKRRTQLGSVAEELSSILRFLLRLRMLLRSFALSSGSARATPITATVSVSSSFIASLTNQHSNGSEGHTNGLHRLIHLSDAAISLSSFAASPLLTTSFPDYTGSLKVVKTPAIGTLHDLSVRASILRGMSSLGVGQVSVACGRSDAKVGAEPAIVAGGAGGGENNLAFKLKRKRIVIETLHLDIEGGVSERRTKPPRNVETSQSPSAEVSSVVRNQIREAGQPEVVATSNHDTTGSRSSRTPSSNTAIGSMPPPAAPAATSRPAFAGLKSLRERGMQVQRHGLSAQEHGLQVEIEDSTSKRSDPAQRALLKKKVPPVFRSAAQDLEF
ncbi:hypothetical protein K437DRAFT_256441 [Tilletiaria anomala UBC 951]|uniref:Elongator complex protein 4 n=1 Tax=Tilletiaria anomala (strain ATCC 24038 / CBS 436.72 / UBC 951) TaxID=1037660 RepID=A0A066VW45_TILAU|nr:uncharacterized protein K437DRAFT_256441 [Tilletiaria anomala UBC 951]KDN45922.1 hypothetical protein K437DRAFT_256441 [Tilletiaria anomala UBC 951]